MSQLTPNMAVELSTIAYTIQKIRKSRRVDIVVSKKLSTHFNFDLSNGPVMGTSGGFVAQAKGQQIGFAVIGKGQSSQYKNDFVIAVRGTNF